MIKKIRKLISGKAELKDIWHYCLGNYRYKLYYSKYAGTNPHPLMRRHIWEQIAWRIKWMDRECYDNGSCKICGCETTALQMCNKSCDKPCYPEMMTKKKWSDWNNPKIPWMHLDKHGLWDKTKEGKPYLSKSSLNNIL